MPVTATNLIMGAGELYAAPFGTTEPVGPTTAPGAGWRNVGGTTDGVTINISQETTELEVDQVVDVVDRRITRRELTIETNLAEATLENLALVLNSPAPTEETGVTTFEPVNDSSVFIPNYSALLFDGFAPGGKRRRVTARRCLSTEGTEVAYTKDEQTVFSVTFAAHYVSPSIKAFSVQDDTSA